jgi:hypothetical protein
MQLAFYAVPFTANFVNTTNRGETTYTVLTLFNL